MKSLNEFLKTSYTAYHAAANARDMLEEAGFKRWSDTALVQGGKYYVIYGNSSIAAFTLGKEKVFHIAQSHSDSPCLKIKGAATVGGMYTRLNAEKYGGAILNSFLDRKLIIAGRVIEEVDGKLAAKLYSSPFHAVIPSLAPHFGVSEGVTGVQTQLLPVIGLNDCKLLENAVDFDLYAVPADEPFAAGENGEFLCSPRLDNLISVYCSLKALINAKPHGISICVAFDNEEIGSRTMKGADGEFFARLLKDIYVKTHSDDGFNIALSRSLALSADNAHAAHPAYPEKSDPVNKVKLNGGIVIKHHTNYATDGISSAIVKKILNDANIPFQDYYHNSDLRCGSTLGLIQSSATGIRTCDIGISQLAMHSALETVGSDDPAFLTAAFEYFFSHPIPQVADKI